uniref:Ataxin-2 C-terminal domain-containing protein n=1 Tax=Anopheles atroparvus TaxID=41427 RepID=A0AAG5CSC5_ANOAO
MKMKMPDNSIGGSSSNSYTHITITVGNALVNAVGGGGTGGGGGGTGGAGGRGHGDAGGNGAPYFSDSYDSDQESVSTPPNEPHSAPSDDFAEYMWMENEDEFDMQELQRLEEEELMDQCIEAMILDEMASVERMPSVAGNVPRESGLMNILSSLQLDKGVHQQLSKNVDVEQSTLNPLAAEFVPSLRTLMAPTSY